MLDYTGKQYFEVGFLNTNTADIDNTKSTFPDDNNLKY